MNGKLILAVPLLIAAVLSVTAPAYAACPVDDPDCGLGGGPTTITRTLNVVDSSQATVTATGINCGVAGDDCTQIYRYTTDEDPPSVALTATGVPAGYTARLFSCTTGNGSTCSGTETQCGVGTCTLTMNANDLVRMSVADETAPSTATVTGPGKVGPSVRHFTAAASDGAGVVAYRYYLDGIDQGLFSPGAGYDVPVSSLAEGSHTLTARGRDAAGNESPALAAAKSFTVDKSTGVTGVSTPSATTESAPDITFTVPADATSVVCRTKAGDTVVGATPNCSSPYSPQGVTTDGQYTVEIAVVDDVGNSATVTRTFTLQHAVADKPTETGGTAGTTSGTAAPSGTSGTAASAGAAPSGPTTTTTAPTARAVTLSTSWRRFGKRTRVDRLTLVGVPKGAKVTVTCKGRGCAFKKKTLRGTGKNIALASRFKHRKLAAKTVITVTVASATGTKRFRYTLRAGRAPKQSIR